MNVLVSGKHLDIGDALRSHIEERMDTGVAKYFDNAIEAKVAISRVAHLFRSDCNVHVGSGIDVKASAEANDPYACFDSAAERIEKQLRRYKRRLRNHHARGNGDADARAQSYIIAPEASEGGEEQEVPEEWHPVIVAESTTSIAECTVGEAVMRMDLADTPALMFRNKANNQLNVVYRRADGNIGWIDPSASAG